MYSAGELQKIIQSDLESRMKKIVQKKPVELFEPIDYTLKMGGKRVRPVLLLMAFNLFEEDIKNALPAAVAIEVFHNFTLLHDDIMDKADVRRNKATVHIKYSENSAILSGDAMAFLSYKYLLESKSQNLLKVIELFSKTAIEVCEGQQYDMDFENRLNVSESEYLEMIKLKTAVLLACSLKAGALLANSSDAVANQLYEFGLNLGWAFQLQDDYLDSFGDQKTFGKKIGGDILANKKTYLLINALEKSNSTQKTVLKNWLNSSEFEPKEKISAIKKIYEAVGIRELTLHKIDSFFEKAIHNLNDIPLPDVVKQELLLISRTMLKRDH